MGRYSLGSATDSRGKTRARHCSFQLFATDVGAGGPGQDFQFDLVPALNKDKNAISFRSVNFPKRYITPLGPTGAEPGRLYVEEMGDDTDHSKARAASFMVGTEGSFYSFASMADGELNGQFISVNGLVGRLERGKFAIK